MRGSVGVKIAVNSIEGSSDGDGPYFYFGGKTMELIKARLDRLKDYPNNPRYNDEAVDAVEASIDQVGYITPIVVDENYQILSGHTRKSALYDMGYDEVEVIMVRGLTEEQKRKFRLLDNKTAEIAEWDLEKLQAELDGLDFGDFDFWSKELEKMADKMIKDHVKPEDKVVICPRCGKVVVGLVDMDDYDV